MEATAKVMSRSDDEERESPPHSPVWKKIRTIFVGHSLYALTSWLFNNPLYILVIALYGPLWGGAVMTALSLTLCFLILTYYLRMRIDWLGVEVIEAVKKSGPAWVRCLETRAYKKNWTRIVAGYVTHFPSKILFFIFWALKKGDIPAFFALSLFEDPFITTAYLRHGSFKSLGRKDWLIFGGSVLVSNGYWILRTSVIVESVRLLLLLH
jgi:hypothetical protein